MTTNVVCAPPGLGKTKLVIDAIAKGAGGPIEYYVPTHVLGEEVRARLHAANPKLRVVVIAGRSHADADGKPLCRKSKIAEEVARAGGDVYASLCLKRARGTTQKCAYYDACPYIGQFVPADVTIYTHAHLPLRRTSLEAGVPKLAIIDESFFQSCIEVIYVPMPLLRAGDLDPLSALTLGEIEIALLHGHALFKHLHSKGIGADKLGAALQSLRRSASQISPAMNQSTQRTALKNIHDRSLLAKLLENVIREEAAGREDSHGLLYDRANQKCVVHLKKVIRRFHDYKGNESRVLCIDGTASRAISEQFFSRVDFTRIPADRRAHVIQCLSTRCSNISLVPGLNKHPTSKRAASRRLRELNGFIGRLAMRHCKVLVVGPQAVTGNVGKKVRPLLKVPSNVVLAHYGAIRGRDEWKDCDAIVVIGRNQPSIDAVEAMARCVFLNDAVSLTFAGDWKFEERGYRLKEGKLGVEVVTHVDPRVQLVHEQVRESESLQAIDRLRLVHAGATKAVFILSNIPLDIDVDELVAWEELMYGSRLRQAWELSNGVLPLESKWLAKNHPKLWATSNAAKQDVRSALKKDGFPNSISISKTIPFRLRYKRKNQRRWSACLSRDQDVSVVAGTLARLLGETVTVKK